jgi:hypothetical protein
MTYLEYLIANRDAILAAALANPDAGAYDSYSLDGESFSMANWVDRVEKLNGLIIREQNRVSGRRELRVVRGRRWYAWR